MVVYLIDEGILLDKDHEEFKQYSQVYNKKYGFWDEEQWFSESEETAIEEAEKYVSEGTENSYAIVSAVTVADDFDAVGGKLDCADYSMNSVVYSVGKFYGKPIQDFLHRRKRVLRKTA